MWFAIAMLVGSYLIQALTAKGAEPAKPSTMADFSFPQFNEDTPQCVVFGDVWLAGWQVLWYGNLRSEAIKGKAKK